MHSCEKRFPPAAQCILAGLLSGPAGLPRRWTLLCFYRPCAAAGYYGPGKRRTRVFRLVFLAFWIWNTGSTWWVGNTIVLASGIFANAFNALLMSIPWLAYKSTLARTGRITGYFALDRLLAHV